MKKLTTVKILGILTVLIGGGTLLIYNLFHFMSRNVAFAGGLIAIILFISAILIK